MITLTTTSPALIAALTPDAAFELDGVPHSVAAVGQRQDGATVIRLRSAREGPEIRPSLPIRIRALRPIEGEFKERGEDGEIVERECNLAAGAEMAVPERYAQNLIKAGMAVEVR